VLGEKITENGKVCPNITSMPRWIPQIIENDAGTEKKSWV
jgi:hypothetical protein